MGQKQVRLLLASGQESEPVLVSLGALVLLQTKCMGGKEEGLRGTNKGRELVNQQCPQSSVFTMEGLHVLKHCSRHLGCVDAHSGHRS